MVPTVVNGRWPVLLPEHRAARPEWPTHEAPRFTAMHDVLSSMDSPVLWDVGAELGDHAAVFASWGCRLVLIEPNPQAWPCIAATIEANEATGAVVGWSWSFIGDQGEPGAWYDRISFDATRWPEPASGPCTGRAGMAHLSGRPDPDPYPAQPTTTIDALVAIGFPPPDALTIDVEGAELKVLRGARATLEQHRPRIWLSVHHELMASYGDNILELVDLIRAADYRAELLDVDHEEHWELTPL